MNIAENYAYFKDTIRKKRRQCLLRIVTQM